MPPSVDLTLLATLAEPTSPEPVLPGHGLSGVKGKSVGSFAARYFSKFLLVPEASERKKTEIFVDGRFALELMALMAGSFQVVILPRKICASTCALSVRSFTPETL